MKKNEEIKFSDFSRNLENPFLKKVVEVVNDNVVKKYQSSTGTSRKAILQAVDQDGEVVGTTSFVRQVEVDEDKFIKIYLSNFQQFFELTTRAIRMFGYIIQAMRVGSDLVYFDLDEALNYTGYKTKASIYQGLAELLAADIIARGKNDNLYYINPLCIFNGNRISFINSYVKRTNNRSARATIEQAAQEFGAERKQLTLDDAFEEGKEA